MIDTHCHLYMEQFAGEESAAVRRALDAGVSHMVFPNVDAGSIAPMKALHALYPEATSMAMGLHPTEVRDDWSEVLDAMERELDTGRYVAIGEIGMDLYWEQTGKELQQQAFRRQLRWAVERGLPVLIHCREALDPLLEILRDEKERGVTLPPLVFHSFTGGVEDVRRIREVCDPLFGINGVVTFKNAPALREALPEIGLDRMLLETDAPYLAPVPHRGQRNESAYIPDICARIAQELSLPAAAVSAQTDANWRRLLGAR